VDNPITGASVPDAVYHGNSAPEAVVIGNVDRSGNMTGALPEGAILSI
jgi:hypothetical protein